MVDKYAAAGVDYDVLDAGKRVAVAAAAATSAYAIPYGAQSIDASRGESAFVYQAAGRYFAQVLECLGTKSSIARQVQEESGENYFDAIGYDSVAAIANDVVCVGALPIVINAYFATGSPRWYGVAGRFDALVDGWRRGCADAGAIWGGGESPGLSGIVEEGEIDLAGSATAMIPEGRTPILGDALQSGDVIIGVASTGIHANGISLARRAASALPQGYQTEIEAGVTFGQALLRPSAMYVPLIAALVTSGADLHYISHITGHGYRKFMRANANLSYRITQVGDVPSVLRCVQQQCAMTDEEAFGTFNMGVGLALYAPESEVDAVLKEAKNQGLTAWKMGHVEEGPRRVVVEEVGVEFEGETLNLR